MSKFQFGGVKTVFFSQAHYRADVYRNFLCLISICSKLSAEKGKV